MKVQNGTTIMGVELNREFINEFNESEPKFIPFLNEMIPKGSFTYLNAINRIIELNDIFQFDWIVIDRGYGEVQLEALSKYGMENPLTGLHEKVIGYQFSESVVVRDPYTLKKDVKPLKPFMVNKSVMAFERGKVVLNPRDNLLYTQLENYKIERINSKGYPTYTDENEHCVDTLNLALLVFEQKYGELFNNIIKQKIVKVGEFTRSSEEKVFGSSSHYNSNTVSTVGIRGMSGYDRNILNRSLFKNSDSYSSRRYDANFKRSKF